MAPRLLKYLGDASYSIYLAHGIVIFVVDRSANLNVGNSWIFKIMLIVAATGAGVVLDELVEKQLTKAIKQWRRRRSDQRSAPVDAATR